MKIVRTIPVHRKVFGGRLNKFGIPSFEQSDEAIGNFMGIDTEEVFTSVLTERTAE